MGIIAEQEGSAVRRLRLYQSDEQRADELRSSSDARGTWYADPYGKAYERWWDGRRWTHKVRGVPSPADNQADSVRHELRASSRDASQLPESRPALSEAPAANQKAPRNQNAPRLGRWRHASARNATARALTTVRYDLIIFDDMLVVARGISWRSMPKDVAALLRAGSMKEAGRRRVAAAQKLHPEGLLAQDSRNKILSPAEVASVQLRRRAGFASIVIELPNGTALRYRWHDIAANGDYYNIRRGLALLFGPKLLSG